MLNSGHGSLLEWPLMRPVALREMRKIKLAYAEYLTNNQWRFTADDRGLSISHVDDCIAYMKPQYRVLSNPVVAYKATLHFTL